MLRSSTALAVALGLIACGSGEETPKSTSAPSAQGAQGEQSTSGCRSVEAPAPKPDGGQRPPRRRIQRGAGYEATVETNCGDFTFELDVAAAPRTAASFVALAQDGFFDGTVFHRIVPGFVIQGGDPTGTGTGGPGYKTVDRPPRDASYTQGVVAMAKAGDEAPGTAGSQFFVVTAPEVGLPPEYAVLGRVTRGLDVVERIAQLGDPASGEAGTPVQPVVMSAVAISRG
jgi:peptidyl-prolyl cis-trans isomerase B (cyclophilin B)